MTIEEGNVILNKFMEDGTSKISYDLDIKALFQVINKIEKMYYNHPKGTYPIEVSIYGKTCEISYEGYHTGTLVSVQADSKEYAIFNACVEFAEKFYNLLEPKIISLLKVNRFEVIDNLGRAFFRGDVKTIKLSLQDNDKTLKVFINNG